MGAHHLPVRPHGAGEVVDWLEAAYLRAEAAEKDLIGLGFVEAIPYRPDGAPLLVRLGPELTQVAADLGLLTQKGSLFLTRPSLFSYTASRKDLEATAQELFEMVQSGKVRIDIGSRYDLADAAHAHRDMEARKTTGAGILIP